MRVECFGYARKMIEDDFLRNGRSTIQKEITKKVKEGKCRCEVMNPQGTCCLGDVAQVMKHQGISKNFSKGGVHEACQRYRRHLD